MFSHVFHGHGVGDGGLAVASSLFRPGGVAVDAAARAAYVGTGQQRLRRVELQTGGGQIFRKRR